MLNQAYWTLSDPGRRARYDAAPLQFEADVRERWTSPRGLLNIVGRLIVMGLMIQAGFMLVGFYVSRQANTGMSASEQAEILRGYAAIHDKLTPEERATGVGLAERQRLREEAKQARREQEGARLRQEWELERDRHYASTVSGQLREAEERERYRAEEERRHQAEIERERQEREQARIDGLRAQWRAGTTGGRTAPDERE